MNNIVEFPMNDPMSVFLRGMRNGLDADTWKKLEPVVNHLIAKHGEMPEWNVSFHPPGFERFTEEERQVCAAGIRQMVFDYGTMCRGLVMADLAAQLVINAELREQVLALKR